MLEDDLKQDGWMPKTCLIGTLWFKGSYFCRIRDEKIEVFSNNDDMNSIGVVDSVDGIKLLQERYDILDIEYTERRLRAIKYMFRERYGHEYSKGKLKMMREALKNKH